MGKIGHCLLADQNFQLIHEKHQEDEEGESSYKPFLPSCSGKTKVGN